MKIDLTKPLKIRQPRYHRGVEAEMDEHCQWIVDQISQRFRNGVLLGLNKRIVRKFEDAQTGNYAVVTRQLSRKVYASIRRQFSNDRVQRMVRAVLTNADKFNREQFYGRIERSVGVSTQQLVAAEHMTEDFNALVTQTAAWVNKLRDETLEAYTTNALWAMSNGESLEAVMAQFEGMVSKRKNHARQTARDQIAHFSAITGKVRAQSVGVTRGIWRTTGDDLVRLAHKDRDGKEFDLSTGLYSSRDRRHLLPGVDYNCRCWTDYILGDD